MKERKDEAEEQKLRKGRRQGRKEVKERTQH